MGVFGSIVVIKRSGIDGSEFPLNQPSCSFGRDPECDIRVQLPKVENNHCKIVYKAGISTLMNFDKNCLTKVNGVPVKEQIQLKDKDLIEIIDRRFRFLYPDSKDGVPAQALACIQAQNDQTSLQCEVSSLLLKPKKLQKTPMKKVVENKEKVADKEVNKTSSKTWSNVLKQAKTPKKACKENLINHKKPKVLSTMTSKIPKSKTPKKLKAQSHVNSPATIYIKKSRSRIQSELSKPQQQVEAEEVVSEEENFDRSLPLFETPKSVKDVANVVASEKCSSSDDVESQTKASKNELFVTPVSKSKKNLLKRSSSILKASNATKNEHLNVRFSSAGDETQTDNFSSPVSSKKIFVKTPMTGKSKKVTTGMGDIKEKAVDCDQPKKVGKKSKKKKCASNKSKLKSEAPLQTPKEKVKNLPVEEKLGLKRLMKTPKEKVKGTPVEEKLGLKRLMKTPKEKVKNLPVEEKLGTKRLLQTPKEKVKNLPVEEKLGTKRLLQTPKEKVKNLPVEEKLGLKRLMQTPKEKVKNLPVEEKLGLKRLMQTPKEKVKNLPVEEKLGLKRLMQTPKEKVKNLPVEEKLGLKRLMQTPKEKVKGTPVENKFGLKRLMNDHQDIPMNPDQYFQPELFDSPPAKKFKKSSKVVTTTKKAAGTKSTRSRIAKSEPEKVKSTTEEAQPQKAKKKKVQENGDKSLKNAKTTDKPSAVKSLDCYVVINKTPKKIEEEEAIKKSSMKTKTPPLKKRLRTKTVNAQNVVNAKAASKNGGMKVASKKVVQLDEAEKKQNRKRVGEKKKSTSVLTKKSKPTVKNTTDDLLPRRSTRRKN